MKRKTNAVDVDALEDLDPQIKELVKAMNLLPGIMTTCSCCGHGQHEIWIFFRAQRLVDLPALLYFLDSCHTGVKGWRCVAKTDCAMSPVTFFVEGPTSDYAGGRKIAKAITAYVNGQ